MKYLKRIAVVFVVAQVMLGCAAVWAGEKSEIPEYVGSQACLSCHTEKFRQWKPSNHAQMVVPIINSSDLPLDISKAPANLQSELRKATYMVANSMCLARDPVTEHYKTLGVSYDKIQKAYVSSGFSLDWSISCAGCHTTNMNTPKLTWSESGIGCEACHGPGRDHILGKGDTAKIVTSKDPDICGQCHGGNDVQTGGNLMSDGSKWIVGFRPGMKLAELKGVQLTPVDPAKAPPDSSVMVNHLRNYNMWAASPHSKALGLVAGNDRNPADCYGCHSADGFAARLQGKKVDPAKKAGFTTISCVACHDPHDSENSHQLIMPPEKLCNSCHTQEATLKGTSVKGIEETKSIHANVNCVQCHMTEANHLMKVIRPDAPDLAEKRADTCTSCHKNSTKKDRATRLQEWQSLFTKKMDALQADLKIIGSATKDTPDRLTAELKGKLNSARGNLSILTRDKSRGAHNFEYAMKVMDQTGTDLDAIKAAIH
jgi:predicted CXXCH cytochrome family protein